ncbi:MAG: lipase maturation factor family protein [Acidobacteriota bacterium]
MAARTSWAAFYAPVHEEEDQGGKPADFVSPDGSPAPGRRWPELAALLDRHGPGGEYRVGPWLFLRGLGATLLIAFVSFWVQLDALVGPHGILPAEGYLDAVQRHFGEDAWWRVPTLAWWTGGSSGALHGICAVGCLASLAVVVGSCTAPALFVAWACYLSIFSVGQDFLSFQWDILLLETTFLAIFLAPWSWRPSGPSPLPAIPRLLLWWLLFRLMVLSGAVKLASGDSSWIDLTALDVHFQTQPLPNPLSRWAHHWPQGLRELSVAGHFVVEIGLPFLIWGPRWGRYLAAFGLAGFMLVIAATGNYGFFNLLAALPCLCLLDDLVVPERWRERLLRPMPSLPAWREWVLVPLALVALTATTGRFVAELDRTAWLPSRTQPRPPPLPEPVQTVVAETRPLLLFNSYGLFRVMTTTRPELIIEGSLDGREWRPYELKYKPGALDRRPAQVAPHMPRLDWQMWFAALRGGRRGPPRWFQGLVLQLLRGSPDVLALFEHDPFDGTPPRYIRVLRYRYDFTEEGNDAVWQRELLGTYLRPQSLPPSRPQG